MSAIVTNNNNYNGCLVKKAFTLAEVLITLGIIGVVAAVVTPTLMTNANHKVVETQFAKSKSTIASGYKYMMAQHSVMEVNNLPFMYCEDNAACYSDEHKHAFNIVADNTGSFSSEVLPQEYSIEGATEKSTFEWDDVPYIFATTDGMVFGVDPDDNRESFTVYVDVNGVKNPNTALKDLHKYRFSGGGRMFDISEDLVQETPCSASNLSGCGTQEQCESLVPAIGFKYRFENGTCSYAAL